MAGKSQAEIAAAVRAYVPTRLTVEEQLMMAQAPRKAPGTQVTVRSYPAIVPFDPFHHMYTEYDDGAEQYIYRGGPSRHGLHAQVTPASESPDFRHGTRVVDETFLPDVSARQAIRSPRRTAERIEGSGAPYLGLWSNSNSAVGEQMEDQFGRRVGDLRTPGMYGHPTRPQRLYPMTQPIW
jgi:hypothetical protein